MRSFETSIDIAARPERVWDVLARVVDWPTWTPTVRAVRPLDAPELAIGRRYEVHQPRLRPAVWEIRSVTPGAEFTWTMATPGLRAEASHRVDPLGPDAARVALAVRMTGPLRGYPVTFPCDSRYLNGAGAFNGSGANRLIMR